MGVPLVRPLDLERPELKGHVTRVVSFFGHRWLRRQLDQNPERISLKEIGRRREDLHPVVRWYRDYQRWVREPENDESIKKAGPALELVNFGEALHHARRLQGFSRLKARLKNSQQFLAAAFEAEVAAIYCTNGWRVEFLQELGTKSPDLKVVHPREDSEFFVECKRRDALTARDRRIDAAWRETLGALAHSLTQRRTSALIEIEWLRDPLKDDLTQILKLVERARELVEQKGGQAGREFQAMYQGEFQLRFVMLTDGASFEAAGISGHLKAPHDRLFIGVEVQRLENSTRWRRPLVLAFRTKELQDKVKGVVQSLKTACRQLPAEAAGVVWIRVPDNSWSLDQPHDFDRATALIEEKLTGKHNRRINEVNLMTRYLRPLEEEGRSGLGYSPLVLTIEHHNPRQTLPILSE